MRSLPFTAQPLLLTIRMALELGLLGFLVIAAISLTNHPSNVTVIIVDFVLGAPAILYPLWLWSRKLMVTLEGVVYSSLFRRTIQIPYREVRTIAIDGKRMMEVGRFVMIYRLHIIGAQGTTITIMMDNYRTADLRNIVEEILAHAEQTRLKGLAQGLLNDTQSFAKV